MDPIIRCVSRYSSSLGSFQPGDVVNVAQLAAALLADSPGSFELVLGKAEAPAAEAVSGAEHHALPIVSKPARTYRRKG